MALYIYSHLTTSYDNAPPIIPPQALLMIHTDSLNSMTSIFTTPKKPNLPELLKYTQTRYFDKSHDKLIFKIPSHEDKHGLPTVKGNDIVDKYAKFAAQRSPATYIAPTLPIMHEDYSLLTNHYRYECGWLSTTQVWDPGGDLALG